jgi:hypothetical protein
MKSIIEPFCSKEVSKIIRQTELILKNLNKQTKKDLFKDLELIYKSEMNTTDSRTFYPGDIVFRPLDTFNDDFNLDLNHYGIALGTSLRNEILILEITQKHNVRIVNLFNFLSKHSLSELQVERKPENVSFDEIIERAKEVKNEIYSATNFNCQHFVKYCVYGNNESETVSNISAVVSPLLDLVTKYLNYKSQFQSVEHKEFILQLAEKTNLIKQEIEKTK